MFRHARPALLLPLAACRFEGFQAGEGLGGDVAVGEVEARTAAAVPTVLELTFTTDVAAVARASFGGEDTDWLVTPWEAEPTTDHHLVLVGMPEQTEVSWEVEVEGVDGPVADGTTRTGALPPGLPVFTPTVPDPAAGFTLSMLTELGDAATGPVLLDAQGRIAWYWEQPGRPRPYPRARLAPDGSGVVYTAGSAILHASWTGELLEELDVGELGRDFTFLPDGSIALLAPDTRMVSGSEVLGDRLAVLEPDGKLTEVWSTWDSFAPPPARGPEVDWTHANSLYHDPSDGAFYVGLRYLNAVVRIGPDGGLDWTLGGEESDFRLDYRSPNWGETVFAPHSVQVVDGGLLIFDNSEDLCSQALELSVDTASWRSTDTWSWQGAKGCRNTSHFGHAERLADGSTVVTWSEDPAIERVTRDGTVTWRIEAEPASAYLGYAEHLESPYLH